MTEQRLNELRRKLKALATELEAAKFKNAEKIFGDYFKTCTDFLEGLAAFLEEHKDNLDVRNFLSVI